MSDYKLRVGFCSTASIGRKTWAAIHDSKTAVVSIVASRDEEKAQNFIDHCQTIKPFENKPKTLPATTADMKNLYEPLYTSNEVDIIYVPLPMLIRYEVIKNALKAGKHVVTEKPVADSNEEVQEMIKLAEENNCLFLDGTMFTHGNRIDQVSSKILSGCETSGIGVIRSISSVFTFNGGADFENNDIRCDPKLEPLGALGDIGWYCIRCAVEALGGPAHISVIRARGNHIKKNDRGVNLSFEGVVEFRVKLPHPADKIETVPLQFYVSFCEAHQMKMDFRGTHGVLHMDDFCLPFRNDKELAYTVERHAIINTDCRVDHMPSVERHAVKETSTNQEEAKWRDCALVFKNLYLTNNKDEEKKRTKEGDDHGDEDEKHQKKIAQGMRESFIQFIKMTNDAMVACYKSANEASNENEVGKWVKL